MSAKIDVVYKVMGRGRKEGRKREGGREGGFDGRLNILEIVQ